VTSRGTAHATLALALGGLLLLAVHPVSRFYPACPIYEHFHVLCPGCGATRALAALLRGDLAAAWRMNALFLLALPFLAWYGVRSFRLAVQPEPFVWPRTSSALLYVCASMTLLFTVVRNL